MLEIDDKIVSLAVLEQKFCCNLKKCRGICCELGDSGAPLTYEELIELEKEYPNFASQLRPECKTYIDKNGVFFIDKDHDYVTMLYNNKECAFVIYENGIASCAIEKAWEKGITSARKPVSCHLYPIRLKEYKDFIAVNYDEWDICKDAPVHGKRENVLLVDFLKDALIRKFGLEWYDKLKYATDNIDKILNR